MPSTKGQTFPTEPLTSDEIKSLLKACSKRAPTGIRNRALIAVLYRSGLRIGEALSLFPRDLDAKAGTLHVRHGKGDKSRVVGLDPGAWAILQLWLDRRAVLGLTRRQGPVFSTLAGEPIKAPYVRALLPRLAKRGGIEKRVHAHGLRHTHAYELANEGTPMHVIQAQLGHQSLAVTDRYVRHLNPREVVERMRERSWSV